MDKFIEKKIYFAAISTAKPCIIYDSIFDRLGVYRKIEDE